MTSFKVNTLTLPHILLSCPHRATVAYHRSKDRRCSHALMLQVFYSWRQEAMLGTIRAAREVQADIWYTEVKLKRNVLRVSCKPGR